MEKLTQKVETSCPKAEVASTCSTGCPGARILRLTVIKLFYEAQLVRGVDFGHLETKRRQQP